MLSFLNCRHTRSLYFDVSPSVNNHKYYSIVNDRKYAGIFKDSVRDMNQEKQVKDIHVREPQVSVRSSLLIRHVTIDIISGNSLAVGLSEPLFLVRLSPTLTQDLNCSCLADASPRNISIIAPLCICQDKSVSMMALHTCMLSLQNIGCHLPISTVGQSHEKCKGL